jgi:hypothetical protein
VKDIMSVEMRVNGQKFRTIDVPESIGPWIARIISVVTMDRGSSVEIRIW